MAAMKGAIMHRQLSRAQTRKVISRTLAKALALNIPVQMRIDVRRIAHAARRDMDAPLTRIRKHAPRYDRQVARNNAVFQVEQWLDTARFKLRTTDKRNDQLVVDTGWLWDKIKTELRLEPWVWDDESQDFQRKRYVGDVFSATPSGKMYMPWSSNVTADEAYVDEEYHENMSAEAQERGMWVDWEDGDCFVGQSCDLEDLEIGESFEIPEVRSFMHPERDHDGVCGILAKRTVKSRGEYTRSAIEKLT